MAISTADSDDAFIAVVQPIIGTIRLLTTAGQAPGIVPAVESMAMAELASEKALPGIDALGEPIHAAHSLARILAFAATDHLRNYTLLFESQPVPVYSHLVLARACLDVASTAYWLGQPGIGTTARAQRYLVMRLFNAKQQDRSPIPGSKQKAKEIRDAVVAGAAAARWSCAPHWNSNHSPQVGTQELPAPKQAIAAVLGGAAQAQAFEELAPLVWWYLSGVTHGVQYALVQAVQVDHGVVVQPQMGAIFTDAKSALLMATTVARAYRTMTEAHMELFGWASDDWTQAVSNFDSNTKPLLDSLPRE